MAELGVHFALTITQQSELLAAVGDSDAVVSVIERFEQAWDQQNLFESDKAWDAIHRCFCDGKLHYEGGEFPLNLLICGGQQLIDDEDMAYTVSYVDAAQVKTVAAAAASLSREQLLSRYRKIKQRGFRQKLDDNHFEYVWANFTGATSFFGKAAADGKAVVFTVDC
jgi:hypothetical protein